MASPRGNHPASRRADFRGTRQGELTLELARLDRQDAQHAEISHGDVLAVAREGRIAESVVLFVVQISDQVAGLHVPDSNFGKSGMMVPVLVRRQLDRHPAAAGGDNAPSVGGCGNVVQARPVRSVAVAMCLLERSHELTVLDPPDRDGTAESEPTTSEAPSA